MAQTSNNVPAITLVKVGRVTFVSGLYWQILSSPRAAVYMPEARRLAREERERSGVAMDVVAVRENKESVQAGFVARGAGAKRGMYSLAATAADVIGGSFIAAFDLSDGRAAVVAAMNGAIIPDSDQVLPLDEARLLVQQLWNDLSGTTKDGEQLAIYAPASVFPGADQPEIADLLPGLKRSQRLRPLSRFSKREIIVGAMTVGTLLISLYALNAYQAHQAELERQAFEARQRELDRIRRQSGRDAKAIALSHPWSASPAPSVMLGHCTQALWSLPLTIDGWPIASAVCERAAVSAKYIRGKGRAIDGFRSKLAAWRPDAAVSFAPDGSAATIGFAVPMPAGGDDALKPITPRLETLIALLQKASLVSIQQQNDVSPMVRVAPQVVEKPSEFPKSYRPQPVAGEPPATPDWRTFAWSVTGTNRTPATFLEGAADEGTRINSISIGFANSKLVWSVSGEIYGK